MGDVDLDRKNWLIPFVREGFDRFNNDGAKAFVARYQHLDVAERYQAWRMDALRRRGILNGPLQRIWPIPDGGVPEKEKGDWHFLNMLSHQLELLFEMRLLIDQGADTPADQLEVLAVLAAQVDEMEASEKFYGLALEGHDPRVLETEEGREKWAKALRRPSRAAGKTLLAESRLDYDQPLLGLPFHYILIYSQTCQQLDIAWPFFFENRRLDTALAEEVRAKASMEKVYLVESIIAMAQADHRITKVEKRLIENVIELVRLPKEEEELLWAQLDSPIDVGELGIRIADPLTKRFIFVQIVVHSLLEDAQSSLEHTFIETFGKALGLTDDQRTRYQAEAFHFLEAHPELIDAFELGGIFQRFKNSLGRKYESIVSDNISKIVTEIRQTGELAKLLAKDATGELTPEESAKVKEQIADVLKSIPALGLFAIPGGSLLLPIVMRLLPFDIMPSEFSEEDETL